MSICKCDEPLSIFLFVAARTLDNIGARNWNFASDLVEKLEEQLGVLEKFLGKELPVTGASVRRAKEDVKKKLPYTASANLDTAILWVIREACGSV